MKLNLKNLELQSTLITALMIFRLEKRKNLYIYVNEKHKSAHYPALKPFLSHEALHQDQFNSINEETYAWTMEAVWSQITDEYPEQANVTIPA